MKDFKFGCEYQANLFEYSVVKGDCSSSFFIKQFANSDLASRMDNEAYILSGDDTVKAYEELSLEKKLSRGKELYPKRVMAWVGYIMRYMSIKYNFSTKYIYSFIKPRELYGLYEAYHSLDNDMVCERIVEAKKINTNLNNADIYREILRKKKQ